MLFQKEQGTGGNASACGHWASVSVGRALEAITGKFIEDNRERAGGRQKRSEGGQKDGSEGGRSNPGVGQGWQPPPDPKPHPKPERPTCGYLFLPQRLTWSRSE